MNQHRISFSLAIAAVWVAAALTACDGDGDDNSPPVWSDAPASVALGQGQTVAVPFTASDPDGSTVEVSFVPDQGLEAELNEAGDQLVVWADYTISGAHQIAVILTDASGAATTVSLAVEVDELGWGERQTWSGDGPEAREHGSLIVDDAGGRVLLFGGSGYDPYLDPLDDMWSYDLASGDWTQLDPAGDVPSGGGSRRVARVPGTTTAYLFGGYGEGAAAHGELYRLEFGDDTPEFTAIDQTNSPGARGLHAFVHDDAGERFVMFGGVGDGISNETWVMTVSGDTATWQQLELDPAPSPRYGFFYGFDRERRRLVVFSGAQGTAAVFPAQDTWILDLAADPPAWELIAEGAEEGVPPGRRNGCFVFDPSGPRLFVFGGTPDAQISEPGLFVFDARPGKEAWTELVLDGEPPIRSSGFGFYDAADDRSLMGFGNTTTFVFADITPLGY